MPSSRKSFMIGCLTGVLFGFILTVAGIYGAGVLFQDRIAAFMQAKLQPPPILVGQKADYNWEVKTLAGSTFDLRTLEGKPVFLHLWSAECIPCRSEIEGIDTLYAQFAEQGVEFACVARAGIDEVPGVIAQYRLKVPVYVYEGARPDPFDDDAVPATYIVAPDGRIVFKHLGAAKWDHPDVAALLESLIGA